MAEIPPALGAEHGGTRGPTYYYTRVRPRARAGMGRAFGNIGNAYSAMGFYEQAIKYHKQELTISKEVNDRSSEASTHGNLAVAYQVKPVVMFNQSTEFCSD